MMSLEERARSLQERANYAIATACEGEPCGRWKGLAAQVVEQLISQDEWEWRVHVLIGEPPKVAIVRYIGP